MLIPNFRFPSLGVTPSSRSGRRTVSPPSPFPTLLLLSPSSPPSLALTFLLYTHQPPILHTPPRDLLKLTPPGEKKNHNPPNEEREQPSHHLFLTMEAWYGSPQGQRGEHGEVGHRRAGAVHRRAAGLQAESVKNVSESRNTTTFVDVLIEQNTTTFANNDPSSIPKLNNETTVSTLQRIHIDPLSSPLSLPLSFALPHSPPLP